MNEPVILDLEPVEQTKEKPVGTTLALPETSPASMMLNAMRQGASVEQVGQMLALQERWEANEARKAYNEAMAAFKAEAIEIIKRKTVDFKTDKGRTTYKHAELADVVDAVGPALSKHGFSWSWSLQQKQGWLDVTCTLKHRLGHSESVTLGAPPDASGGKNTIQSIVSTKTYLERHTLKAICGVAEKGEDNDGQGAGADGDGDAGGNDQDAETILTGRNAAMEGMASLTAWWAKLDAKQRGRLQGEFGKMRKAAKEADDAR